MPLVWVPYADRAEAERRLGAIPAGLELDFYRADGDALPATIGDVAYYVLPYMKGTAVLDRVADMGRLEVVQTLTAGDEDVLPLLPDGVTLCNAAGLHDTSTAELAVALALASGRHLDVFARNQVAGRWEHRPGRALADQRVLIVGYGHIGAAIEARLQGFEVASITRLSRRGRTGPPPVHPFESCPRCCQRRTSCSSPPRTRRRPRACSVPASSPSCRTARCWSTWPGASSSTPRPCWPSCRPDGSRPRWT